VADYDVFVSYHWRDRPQVEGIARALREKHNLHPFLDRWYLIPGQPWPKVLQDVLNKCRAVAVFIGPGEFGPWQQREIYLALERQGKCEGFPLIPVLLPGADPVLGFLGQYTWVDFRQQHDEASLLAILAAAIQGVPPGPDLQERICATLASVCPYRGLLYFREEDAPFFFGRDLSIGQLTEAVLKKPFVAMVGASGSGKSSVVRAGLAPGLRRQTDRVWEVATMVPGDRPLHALAAALLPALEPQLTETDRLIEVNKLARAFADAEVSLRDVVHSILNKQSGTDRLLLVVDQWEELYTLTHDDVTRRRFVDDLLETSAKENTPLTLVLTLRGDYVGKAFAYRPLSDRLQDAQVNLGPMTRQELELAIKLPAEKVKLEFEAGLIERILDDVGDEPGNLPLLEFVLKRLWEERRGPILHHEAYRTMGWLKGAVAKKAEDVFGRLSPQEQETVHHLFLQIVRPGDKGEDTRRRARFAEVGETSREVVKKLADERLLVTSMVAQGTEETIEVAHEALIRTWDRLRSWLNEDREFLLWRERLRVMVSQWYLARRDKEALLRGPLLDEAKRWLGERTHRLTPEELEYVITSRNHHEEERRLDEERRQREFDQFQQLNEKTRRLEEEKKLAGEQQKFIDYQKKVGRIQKGMVFLLILAVLGLVWFAVQAYNKRQLAEEQQRIATSRRLAVQALNHLPPQLTDARQDNYFLALLEAVHGVRISPTVEARSILLTSLALARHPLRFFWGGKGTVSSLAFSLDSKTIASAYSDNTVVMWEVSTRKSSGPLPSGHSGGVTSMAFSPDGTLLATGGLDDMVIVWDLATHRPVGEYLRGYKDRVTSVAFSPDGKFLAVASLVKGSVKGSETSPAFGEITVWDLGTRLPACGPLKEHKGAVESLAFIQDGKLIVSTGSDATVLWDTAGCSRVRTIRENDQDTAGMPALSPDGGLLAVTNREGRVFLHDSGSGRSLGDFYIGQTDFGTKVALGPNGEAMALSGPDGTVKLWNLNHGSPVGEPLMGHVDRAASMLFSRDGRLFASSSPNGSVMLWDLEKEHVLAKPLREHQSPLTSVAFSPDGKLLASSGSDGTVVLWDMRSLTPLRPPMFGPKDDVRGAVFSPDSRTLATVGSDHNVMLWDVAKRQPVGTPMLGHKGTVTSAVFSPNGRLLASSSLDGSVILWDVANCRPSGDAMKKHKDAVTSLAFSKNGTLLASASWDGTVVMWDVASRKPLGEPLRNHNGSVTSLSFSSDGKLLASASSDKTVVLWDVAARKPLGEPLRSHTDPVACVSFSPDGKFLASGGWDNLVILWDVSSRKPLGLPLWGHTDLVTSVAFSADGNLLASAGSDATVMIWDVSLESWISRACSMSNRKLSLEEWSSIGNDGIPYEEKTCAE
jgi:WD40 repeat protein